MSANIDSHTVMTTSRYSNLAGHAHMYPRQQRQSLSSQQTLHSGPEIEEDAKAAMAMAGPRRDVNAAGWSTAMHVLRWLSFLICVAVMVAEVVVAVCLRPYDDTAIGIIGGVLIGGWNVWRFIYRRRTKRSLDEPLAITHLVIEGLLLVLVVVCLALIGWQATVVSREFFVNRYIPLLIVANLLGYVAHGLPPFRTCANRGIAAWFTASAFAEPGSNSAETSLLTGR